MDSQVLGSFVEKSQPECKKFMKPASFPFKVEVCGLEKIKVEDEDDPVEIDFIICKT
jgi:hypothetical protein